VVYEVKTVPNTSNASSARNAVFQQACGNDKAEFLYYLKRYGYQDYLTSDTSPTRWGIRGVFEANSRLTRKIWDRLDRIDGGRLDRLITGEDYLETWSFIEQRILSLD
jgi:xylose isomerase